MRVMTFNLRYDEQDDPNVWAVRKKSTKEIIENYKPDVVGFQEALQHMYEDLVDMLGQDYESYGQHRTQDDGSEMSPIFVRKDKFKLGETSWFMLSQTPEELYSHGWDAALPRIATVCQLLDAASGELSCIIINTHFDHEGHIARLRSSELVVERANELSSKYQVPVIITGDFNASKADPDLEPLFEMEGFVNTEDLLVEYEEKGHYETFHDYSNKVEGVPIDHIFVQEPLKVEEVKIVRDEPFGVQPSDHYPVYVDIVE